MTTQRKNLFYAVSTDNTLKKEHQLSIEAVANKCSSSIEFTLYTKRLVPISVQRHVS